MATTETTPGIGPLEIATSGSRAGEGRAFVRGASLFVLFGLLIYSALYAIAERLVDEQALRNRFHVVQTAEPRYDYVILGASHAAVFDYRDMNARLEEMTGASVLNLANVGAGVTVNHLLLDYFLLEREAGAIVYVLDSFAFYSSEWNEDRLKDSNLYLRAPWDRRLAGMLLTRPGARSAALGYISGFAKINDRNRFEPDLFEAEGSTFDRVYRPIAQLDRQRIDYLYADVSPSSIAESPYLAELEAMIGEVLERGARFVIVRPPVPDRFREMIPYEAEFDAAVRQLVQRTGAELHDFSSVANDPEYFYDSDHLNREGVLNFFEEHLSAVLTPLPEHSAAPTTGS